MNYPPGRFRSGFGLTWHTHGRLRSGFRPTWRTHGSPVSMKKKIKNGGPNYQFGIFSRSPHVGPTLFVFFILTGLSHVRHV